MLRMKHLLPLGLALEVVEELLAVVLEVVEVALSVLEELLAVVLALFDLAVVAQQLFASMVEWWAAAHELEEHSLALLQNYFCQLPCQPHPMMAWIWLLVT